jgi:hypothetical protein
LGTGPELVSKLQQMKTRTSLVEVFSYRADRIDV